MTNAEKLKRMASPDVLELNALVDEVEAFEKTACPVPAPTLPEAMRFRRDQMAETQREMLARAGMSLARWLVSNVTFISWGDTEMTSPDEWDAWCEIIRHNVQAEARQ